MESYAPQEVKMEQEGREEPHSRSPSAQQIWEREGKKDGDHERHAGARLSRRLEERSGEDGAGDTGSQTGRKAGGAKGNASRP